MEFSKMASKLFNIPKKHLVFFYKEKYFSRRRNPESKLVDLDIRNNERINLSKRWIGGEQ